MYILVEDLQKWMSDHKRGGWLLDGRQEGYNQALREVERMLKKQSLRELGARKDG